VNSHVLVELSYIASAILFIFGIKMLGSAATARRGNIVSSIGMLIAIVATCVSVEMRWEYIIAGAAVGTVIGAWSLPIFTSEGGKLLVFPVKDVPELARGKGNKLFDIPTKKFANREDFLTGMAVVPKDKSLVVRSGERKMTLSWSDLKDYRGQRAQRGSVLPRGWRTVDVLETE
jgi:DNA gyrase/topoisomerase IV subunit A